MVGTTIGHYRILELLGKGGMGEVYLADDTRLQRQVALKVLTKDLAGDPDRRERFEREARAAAALNHPNIVTIHSVEEVDGVPFLTLELVEGQTLADQIPKGGFPIDRLLTLAIPLADAVGAAHQRGITHRDLKPANVMVTSDGRIKVLDFGLAKLKEDAREAVQGSLRTGDLTGEGRIVGTASYMSPEQAEGKTVDQRSDVFSLGVILYEMATGERPFGGDTQLSVLSSIIKDTPRSVSDLRRDLPRDFTKIVGRCLAKDVEDRYQTAKDLRNELRALKNDLTSGDIVPVSASGERAAPPPSTPATTRLALYGIAAVVLLVIAGFGVMRWRGNGAPAATARRAFDSITLTRLTTTGTAGFAAISADGRYVAHVATKDGKSTLWLRQVATSSNVTIVPPAEVRFRGVSFSPDGNHIYYVVYPRGANIGSLYEVPVLGGGSRLIVEDIDSPVTFSPDATKMAFLRGFPDKGATAIMVVNADGSSPRQLALRSRPLDFPLDSLSWSPDGATIAAPGLNGLKGELVLVDAASGKERVLPTHEWRAVGHVAWLPDGSGILVNAQESAGEASNQIWLVDYPSGSARRITNDLSTYSGLSLSPTGNALVCIRNERRSTIWTAPTADPAKAEAVATDAGTDDGIYGVAWTTDGRIVYTTEASGNPDIWIMGADGSRRTQLTATKGQDVGPRVTSDGRFIVFVSDRDGANRPWRMGLDGSGATRLSPDAVARSRVALSADGKWVYYSEISGDTRKVSIDGGTPVSFFGPTGEIKRSAPLPPGFHEPMPSPDGTMLAGHYSDEQQKGERIVILSLAGDAPDRRFPSVPANATWAPDGKSLLYTEGRGGVDNIIRQPLTGGTPVALTHFTNERIFWFAVSPDQRQIGVVRGHVTSDVVLIASGQK